MASMASLFVVSKPDGFAESLAREIGAIYCPMATYRIYPSGRESNQVLSDPDRLKGQNVLFVNRGEAPFDSNRVFAETMLATGMLADEYKSRVWTMLPGFPYAREDKEFVKGTVVARSRVIADLQRHCRMLFTVGEHSSRGEDYVCKGFFNISPVPSAVGFAKGLGLRDALALAPDGSANDDVLRLAKALGTGSDAFYKKRDLGTGAVKVFSTLPDLKGRDLLIYDDMIGMGRTLRKAVAMGFDVSLIYTVSRINIDHLDLMPALLKDLGVRRFFIQVIGISLFS